MAPKICPTCSQIGQQSRQQTQILAITDQHGANYGNHADYVDPDAVDEESGRAIEEFKGSQQRFDRQQDNRRVNEGIRQAAAKKRKEDRGEDYVFCPKHGNSPNVHGRDERGVSNEVENSGRQVQFEFECEYENGVMLGLSYPMAESVPQGLENKVFSVY